MCAKFGAVGKISHSGYSSLWREMGVCEISFNRGDSLFSLLSSDLYRVPPFRLVSFLFS